MAIKSGDQAAHNARRGLSDFKGIVRRPFYRLASALVISICLCSCQQQTKRRSGCNDMLKIEIDYHNLKIPCRAMLGTLKRSNGWSTLVLTFVAGSTLRYDTPWEPQRHDSDGRLLPYPSGIYNMQAYDLRIIDGAAVLCEKSQGTRRCATALVSNNMTWVLTFTDRSLPVFKMMRAKNLTFLNRVGG